MQSCGTPLHKIFCSSSSPETGFFLTPKSLQWISDATPLVSPLVIDSSLSRTQKHSFKYSRGIPDPSPLSFRNVAKSPISIPRSAASPLHEVSNGQLDSLANQSQSRKLLIPSRIPRLKSSSLNKTRENLTSHHSSALNTLEDDKVCDKKHTFLSSEQSKRSQTQPRQTTPPTVFPSSHISLVSSSSPGSSDLSSLLAIIFRAIQRQGETLAALAGELREIKEQQVAFYDYCRTTRCNGA